ncbi:IS30 family transposase [Levilactobacillus tujiorum]|uniref:IS30 family transposase n=1 Tax=Levilactobacillus tujiorum TaxID=2912243 RepID=UPI001F0E787E|nr:IS30 family transposase [Levilactobacillus tujiorum]
MDSFVHRFQRIHPDDPFLSIPTIYRYIDLGLFPLRHADLPIKLHRRAKNSKKSHQRMNQKVLSTSIDERHDIVDERTTIDDWEGDMVKGKRAVNEPAVMTLADRMSRFEIIFKIPNYHADTYRYTLQGIIDKYGIDKFHSVTFDNSSEFSLLNQIKGVKVYVAKVQDALNHRKSLNYLSTSEAFALFLPFKFTLR